MFDVNTVSRRYFQITIGAITLEVEPPKIKALKKIINLSKSKDETALTDLSEAIGMILNKNKTGYVIPVEILDELDLDQMSAILTAYFDWLNDEKNSPN